MICIVSIRRLDVTFLNVHLTVSKQYSSNQLSNLNLDYFKKMSIDASVSSDHE